ncbi:MAG: restriction endonuclease subunit S [Vibrio ordalii]|uniref:restriction endonuclease subunit S n=1 Tax=Vibrio ordalii TaxID=28174 RepID=UPI003F30FF0A
MSLQKKVPEIRFKGFNADWEKYPLSTFISSLDAGVSVNSGDRPANESEFGILKTSCVTNGFFEPYENKIVFKAEEINRLKEPVLENTIIISRMNTPALVGANAYINQGFANYFLPDRLWAAKPTSKGDLKFIAYILGSDKGRLALSDLATGTSGSMKNISKPSALRLMFCAPCDQEQTAIGNTFQKLNSLINQHQQKQNKLSNIKKAMLEKMFPKQGETIPEIRFKGFSGEWEEKEFGACFVNVPSNTLSRADLNYKTGLAKNIHYGDVLIKFGEILDTRNELLPLITNDDIANKLKHAALRDGDIIIADAAEDSTVGKCTELFNIGDQLVLSGLHTIAVRPTLSFASKYLGYYLNSSSYHDQLLSLMQGTKVLSISKTTIQNTYVVFPNNTEEQTAIGNYFQKLDALINQHQQQITKLTNIKQACLSKMFV